MRDSRQKKKRELTLTKLSAAELKPRAKPLCLMKSKVNAMNTSAICFITKICRIVFNVAEDDDELRY